MTTATAPLTPAEVVRQGQTPTADERQEDQQAEMALRDAERDVVRLEARERALVPPFDAAAKTGDLVTMKRITAERAEIAEQIVAARIAAGRADVRLQEIRYGRVAALPHAAAAGLEPARVAAVQAQAAFRAAELGFRQAQQSIQVADNLVAGALRERGRAQGRLATAIKAAAALVSKEGGAA